VRAVRWLLRCCCAVAWRTAVARLLRVLSVPLLLQLLLLLLLLLAWQQLLYLLMRAAHLLQQRHCLLWLLLLLLLLLWLHVLGHWQVALAPGCPRGLEQPVQVLF
jgi:hypothetical protein